jgi:hypothetical protein
MDDEHRVRQHRFAARDDELRGFLPELYRILYHSKNNVRSGADSTGFDAGGGASSATGYARHDRGHLLHVALADGEIGDAELVAGAEQLIGHLVHAAEQAER